MRSVVVFKLLMQNPICHLARDWMNWNTFQTNGVRCQKFQPIRTNPAQGRFGLDKKYRIQSGLQSEISDSGFFPGNPWCSRKFMRHLHVLKLVHLMLFTHDPSRRHVTFTSLLPRHFLTCCINASTTLHFYEIWWQLNLSTKCGVNYNWCQFHAYFQCIYGCILIWEVWSDALQTAYLYMGRVQAMTDLVSEKVVWLHLRVS